MRVHIGKQHNKIVVAGNAKAGKGTRVNGSDSGSNERSTNKWKEREKFAFSLNGKLAVIILSWWLVIAIAATELCKDFCGIN